MTPMKLSTMLSECAKNLHVANIILFAKVRITKSCTSLTMKKFKVVLTLTEELLGTKPADKAVFASFIASRAPDEDLRQQEIDTAEHREMAGTTVFHKMNGQAGVWDYQIKGFFKDACHSLRAADETASKNLKAYKTKIDGLVFVTPRFIPISVVGNLGLCERPLRAETAQGPRVSLVRSETIAPGSTLEFEVTLLAEDMTEYLQEWLQYGMLRGLGQWRNSGKGRFTAEITEIETPKIKKAKEVAA
jgi:hypothetical protein